MIAKQRSVILAVARACEVDAFATGRQTFDTSLDSLTAPQSSGAHRFAERELAHRTVIRKD